MNMNTNTIDMPDRNMPSPRRAATRRASVGLIALLALQAWVWTASALPKVTSGAFLTGFARFVATPPPTRPVVYGHLVTRIVLAAPSLFAWGAIATECLLALTFTVATLVMLARRGRVPLRLIVATAAASLVGAGFALNLALLVGDPAPWTLGDPFDSGVAIEYLLVGLSLATAAAAIGTIRASAWPHRVSTAARRQDDVNFSGRPTAAPAAAVRRAADGRFSR
jgi:hypothetical protein